MIKKISVLLLIVCMAFQLFACGNGNTEPDESITDSTSSDNENSDDTSAADSDSNVKESGEITGDTSEITDTAVETADETAEDTTAAETEIEIVFDKKNAVKFIEGTGEADGGSRKLKMYIDINDRVVAIEDSYDFPEEKDYAAKKLFVGYTPDSYNITVSDAATNHLEYEYMPTVLENYKKMSYETVKSIIFSKLTFGEPQDMTASEAGENTAE